MPIVLTNRALRSHMHCSGVPKVALQTLGADSSLQKKEEVHLNISANVQQFHDLHIDPASVVWVLFGIS